MHDRLSTPDILGSIMSAGFSNKTIKQQDQKEIKKETHKSSKQAVEEEVKEKATFNLPKELLLTLEDTCHEMRKLCRSKQVSKTLLVEEALKMAFTDFAEKKQTGKFFQRLLGNKAIKQ